jgi:hypothetical protein
MVRSALEVVTLYNLEIWNKGRIELVPELCAERVVRHDANSVTVLDLDEQIARIRHNYDELRPTFEPVVLAGDDEYITLVWNVTGRDPNWKWCGIEVFRVLDGKIVEVWNAPYVDGRWSQEGRLVARDGNGPGRSIPVMSAELADEGGMVVVPLEAGSIATWLGGMFGSPTTLAGSEGTFAHEYALGGPVQPINLFYSEGSKARALSDVCVERLHIQWARSGLTNATVYVTGSPAEGNSPDASEESPTIRLAECFGEFGVGDGPRARVVGASVQLDRASGSASGTVTVRLPATTDPLTACGPTRLEFGWRHDDNVLSFLADARIENPSGAFTDGEEVEASFDWTATSVVSTLAGAALEAVG